MNNSYPSIFNDVIGPVMRGPSSSHCAAAVRIGRIVRDLMDRDIEEVLIEFDPQGSLATTHASQGSDMGLFAGILGWEPTDERLLSSGEAILAAGIKVKIKISSIKADHPNTYKMTVNNSREDTPFSPYPPGVALSKSSSSMELSFRWRATIMKPWFMLDRTGTDWWRT